jgi:RNA polymerase-binding transcription factor DksA
MSTPTVSPRTTTDPHLAAHLAAFESTQQRLLDELPATDLDVVAAAHRGSIERTLEEVRLARQRLAEGRYGTCASCADPISEGRLQLRPWATRCTRCAERPRW